MAKKERFCQSCGDLFFPTSAKNIYCGSQILKKGCAYKRYLSQVGKWAKKNPEKMKPLWRKATNKYRNKIKNK